MPKLVRLSFDPATVRFDPQVVGTTSAPRSVKVTNSGDALIQLSSYGRTSDDFDVDPGNCPISMKPGDSCTYRFTFTPTKTGALAGGIQFNTLAGTIAEFDMTGTGQPGPPKPPKRPGLSFDPATVKFDPQAVGTTSAPKNVKVTNSGDALIQLSSYGRTSDDFDVDPGNCPISMKPGDSCTYRFTFTPTKTGALAGGIQFNTLAGTIAEFDMTGTGK